MTRPPKKKTPAEQYPNVKDNDMKVINESCKGVISKLIEVFSPKKHSQKLKKVTNATVNLLCDYTKERLDTTSRENEKISAETDLIKAKIQTENEKAEAIRWSNKEKEFEMRKSMSSFRKDFYKENDEQTNRIVTKGTDEQTRRILPKEVTKGIDKQTNRIVTKEGEDRDD